MHILSARQTTCIQNRYILVDTNLQIPQIDNLINNNREANINSTDNIWHDLSLYIVMSIYQAP